LHPIDDAGGTAIVVVTHDEKVVPTFGRLHPIRDGSTHEEAGGGRSLRSHLDEGFSTRAEERFEGRKFRQPDCESARTTYTQ